MTHAALWIALALTAGAAPGVEAPADAHALMIARQRLFASVRINGVGPYPFLLDTASPHVAVDAPIAGFLNLPAQGDAIESGGFSAQPVRVRSLEAAGRARSLSKALSVDMRPMEAVYGMRIGGILGLAGLPRRFRLDVQNRELGRLPAAAGDDWISVPLEMEADGLLRVTAVIDGGPAVRLVVDTALPAALALPRETAEDAGLLDEGVPRLRVLAPDEATSEIDGALQARFAEVAVGEARLTEPVCVIRENASEGALGLGFLKHFEAGIDQEQGELLLKSHHPAPFVDPPVLGPGVAPGRRMDGLWTLLVAEGSPADLAGVQPGDRLLAVNGADMTERSWEEAVAALTLPAGEEASLTVLRGDAALEFGLTATELLKRRKNEP